MLFYKNNLHSYYTHVYIYSTGFKMSAISKVGLAGFSIFGVILLKHYLRGRQYKGKVRLDGKTVIITGANGGLGKATAKELALRGAKVIMACRNLDKAHAARDEILLDVGGRKHCDGSLEIMLLDLASFESIKSFVEEVNARCDKVDILINNAGVYSPTRQETDDGLELTIGVCHFGHFMLTALLLNKLEVSSQGRIIFVSSNGHFRHKQIDFDDIMWSSTKYSGIGAYHQSKLANVLCTRELAKRLSDTRVTVNCLHPGHANDDFFRNAPFRETVFERVILYPLKTLMLKSPEDGVHTILRLALDPNLKTVSGKYFRFEHVFSWIFIFLFFY